jgi:hypothetical protein
MHTDIVEEENREAKDETVEESSHGLIINR